MRTVFLFVFLGATMVGRSQHDTPVSTIDFVQILNDNRAEALFYYENNWKALRDTALQKKFIHSYQVLESPYSEVGPFDLMLITNYASQRDYELAEARFEALIEEQGPLKLMNDKTPDAFRKVRFSKLATDLFKPVK